MKNKKMFISIFAALLTFCCFDSSILFAEQKGTNKLWNENTIYYKKPDGMTLVSHDKGKTWEPFNVYTHYIYFKKSNGDYLLSRDNGLTWELISKAATLESKQDSKDMINPDKYQVYPVPAKDIIHLKINNPETGNYNLKILDYLGNIQLNKFIDNLAGSDYQVDLDVSIFNEGTYIMAITNGNDNVLLPLVIVK